jgi:hypothetical protein
MITVSQDGEHLRLLSIFHYVVGGFLAFLGCFPLVHVGIGLLFLLNPAFLTANHPPPPFPTEFFGLFFVVIGGTFVIAGWTLAALVITAGRFLSRRKHHTFCVVVGAVSCAFFPFGTALGVFTLIVLLRPAVKELFA